MNPDAIDLISQREQHYQRFLGPLDQGIMHSTDVKPVHIDIYTFAPTAQRPFFTLITGGMSDLPQAIPPDWNIALRAEIMMYVQEPQRWMYNVLKSLGEMPFDEETFLSYGHTVPNGMPMTAGPSLLTGYFFVNPILEPDGFTPMMVDNDDRDILLLIPITDAERQHAIDEGVDSLLDIIAEKQLDPVVNEQRACLITNERPPNK